MEAKSSSHKYRNSYPLCSKMTLCASPSLVIKVDADLRLVHLATDLDDDPATSDELPRSRGHLACTSTALSFDRRYQQENARIVSVDPLFWPAFLLLTFTIYRGK